MGTPEFAVQSLSALLEAGMNVVAVVTQPDKPAGRGLQIQQSAVKIFALSKGLPLLQPEKMKEESFLEQLRSYKADLQVVVAFRMLPEVVWNMPSKGTINVHGSILPQYRGAAPINWAIINGEKETGVTTFFLKHEIDTGNIIGVKKVTIEETDTAGIVHDKLMYAGAELLVETVKNIEDNSYKEVPQENLIEADNLKYAPKIFKADCLIDWNNNYENIYNKIRGLSPYPTGYCIFQNKILKIYQVEKEPHQHTNTLGSIISDNKTYLKFACVDGYIYVKELQLEGKKRMNIEEFLRGVKL